MVSKTSAIRKHMWVSAFILFVIGDLVTTYFGMSSPFVYERNSIAAGWFNNGDYIALFLFKLIPFVFLYWLDLVLVDKIEGLALPLIPAYLIFNGVTVMQGNLEVLQSVNIAPEIVIATFVVVSFAFIQIAKDSFGYEGVKE